MQGLNALLRDTPCLKGLPVVGATEVNARKFDPGPAFKWQQLVID
jgi:N-acetyl-anhydromuramyl-L-alanine amidase AmpD